MWIILTPEIAKQVTGQYGDYNSILPTTLKDGNYALHISVLDYEVFAEIHNILANCPVVDSVEYEETGNVD